MGKKYISKRLQKENGQLQQLRQRTNTIDSIEQVPTSRPATPTSKKLNTARANLRNRSTSTIGLAVGGEGEDLCSVDGGEISSDSVSFDYVNIIIGLNVILNLINRFCCPSCRRIGKMSQKVTQRRGLLYHIKFSCVCSFETSITNSTHLDHSTTTRMDELNMMACVAANIVGIKRTGMTAILGSLNILPPVQIENWNKYQKIYSDALLNVKDESLGMAGKMSSNFFTPIISFLIFIYSSRSSRTVNRIC